MIKFENVDKVRVFCIRSDMKFDIVNLILNVVIVRVLFVFFCVIFKLKILNYLMKFIFWYMDLY